MTTTSAAVDLDGIPCMPGCEARHALPDAWPTGEGKLCSRTVLTVGGHSAEGFGVEVAQHREHGRDPEPLRVGLWVNDDGRDWTAQEARAFAAGLLDAAEQVEGSTRRLRQAR